MNASLSYFDLGAGQFVPLPPQPHSHDQRYVQISHLETTGNPHPQYISVAEGNLAYEPIGEAGRQMTTHLTPGTDPHPNYNEVHVGSTSPVGNNFQLWIDTSI